MNKDQIELQLNQIFAAYEITEASVSTLPDIIRDIMSLVKSVDEEAYDRGTDGVYEDLSYTKAGRAEIARMLDEDYRNTIDFND